MPTPDDRMDPSPEPAKSPSAGGTRRRFLRVLSGVAATAAAAPVVLGSRRGHAQPHGGEAPHVPESPEAFAEGNHLERMRAELHRALRKPLEERKWGMAIDLQKCIGCKACTVSCVAENNLPPGVVYRPVLEEEIGTFPNVSKRFIPRPCMQCDDPPCVPPCPVGATFKRPDGVVAIDYDQCIGCRYCVTSCPYGARSFDFGEFHTDGTPEVTANETRPTYEYGQLRQRDPSDRTTSPMGNARKCHFCLHRLAVGLLPACVTTCLGGATLFGDLNDPESLISEVIATERVMRLKEDLGTHPKVFYLT